MKNTKPEIPTIIPLNISAPIEPLNWLAIKLMPMKANTIKLAPELSEGNLLILLNMNSEKAITPAIKLIIFNRSVLMKNRINNIIPKRMSLIANINLNGFNLLLVARAFLSIRNDKKLPRVIPIAKHSPT